MKLLYYVKTTLKGLVASGAVAIIYYILFPILLAGFVGFAGDLNHGAELKLKSIHVEIIDEDKSEMSKRLQEFLKSEEVSEIVTLVEEKPEVELVIKKGYGDNLLALNKDTIILNRKTNDREITTNTLKIILDNYHQSQYVSLAGGDVSDLEKVTGQSIIENVIVDKPQGANNYEMMAVSMLAFVVTMLIFDIIQAGYLDISVNLDKRVNTAPVTKIQFLIYDSAAALVYSFVILSLYIMFFRITGITFKGNIFDLVLLIIIASIFIVSIVKFITNVFGTKVGKAVGGIIFMLPIIDGQIFSLGSKGNALTFLTPTHYINNAMSMYILNGNLQGTGKWLFIILITSMVLYSITIIKVSYKRRRKLCA